MTTIDSVREFYRDHSGYHTPRTVFYALKGREESRSPALSTIQKAVSKLLLCGEVMAGKKTRDGTGYASAFPLDGTEPGGSLDFSLPPPPEGTHNPRPVGSGAPEKPAVSRRELRKSLGSRTSRRSGIHTSGMKRPAARIKALVTKKEAEGYRVTA